MKMIPKTKALLLANKAESMAEVTVAFMVLTIVLTLFAQGMRFAQLSENYAIDRSRDADSAMKEMLDAAILDSGNAYDDPEKTKDVDFNGHEKLLKLTKYKVLPDGGGDICIYYVYDANLS